MTRPVLYTWEIQRRHHGHWSHQSLAGEPADPRGADHSTLDALTFARNIAEDHQPQGEWRIVVWDKPGVGHPPAVILDSVNGAALALPAAPEGR